MSKPTGLYIHVPFCVKKCPYCDFYSGELRNKSEYISAVLRNLRRFPEMYDTVYFGGGTPSLCHTVAGEVLSNVRLSENAEITFECNPETVDCYVFEDLKKAGVNRLSFGVQSLNDSELSALGRIHSAGRAEGMLYEAAKHGFTNVSADLMLGVPQQTRQSLVATIDRLCGLPVTHISAYMLKIEPNTAFGKNPPVVPDDDEQAELYLLAVSELEKRGFRQYEISNFAKEGYESRHNLKYWHCEEYIGIGPSAHSFYKGVRYAVPRSLADFIESDVQPEVPTETDPDSEEEHILLGLRLTEGIPLTDEIRDRLPLIPKNLYRTDGERLSLTPEGFLVSNNIISMLI